MNRDESYEGERRRSYREARHPMREKGRDLFLADRFGRDIYRLVSTPKRILVLGSADGKEAAALRNQFPEVLVVSMDLSETEVAELSGKDPNLVLADWNFPPFQSGCFDLAVFFAALHHSQSLTRTLRAVVSILKPGGSLYATHEPMASALFGKEQKRRMADIGEREGGIETSPSYREYRTALAAAGFEGVRIEASGLNVVRLQEMEEGFEDVRLRRSDWPERLLRALLKAARPLGDRFLLNLIFLVQRLTFGLFGVTLSGRKPHER